MDLVGLELDDAACATRRAAGLRTMQCDVAAVDFECGWLGQRRYGLIASPPCQAWSTAGKGGGRRDKDHVVRCAGEMAAGSDTRAMHAEQCEDPRSILVVEPLRWALALEPEWVAFEQVPPVLELWTMFAQILGLRGYSTWAGVLEAERYGVPQTRERAVLLARRTDGVHPPHPTHQRYVPGQPQRHDHTLDGEVVPWVSMAEALGWHPDLEVVTERGAGMVDRVGERPSRSAREPAPTLTAGGSRWSGGPRWSLRMGNRANATEREIDEPAPTLLFGHRANSVEFVPVGLDSRGQSDGRTGKPVKPRPLDAPAPTIAGQTVNNRWIFDRPATTVQGDPRLAQPGHHERQMNGAIRVTVEQAAALQTFPTGYPWQGSKSKQFEQVGNAVPPLLAFHILRAVTGLEAVGAVAEASERTLTVGDVVEMYGRSYEVRGVKLVEGGPKRMLLMVRAGSDAHPFDWMPEASVLRHVTRRESGAAV